MKPAFFSPSNATLWIASLTALSLATAGCASIRSTKLPVMDSKGDAIAMQGGMIYYLPKQRLKLTLTVTDSANGEQKTRTVTVATTDAFADRNARYVAQYRRNQIGSNTLKVKVNANGLLDGDNEGSNTPQVAEFLGRLALGLQREQIRETGGKGCDAAGTYEWVFDAFSDPQGRVLFENQPFPVSLILRNDGTSNVLDPLSCGLVVTIEDVGGKIDPQPWQSADPATRGHGYFYRQKRPIQISVRSIAGELKTFLHTITDENSPTEYLPVPRTLLSTSTWKVTFSGGSPTFYDVTAGGEVLGLVKLPADVLKAYSEAFTTGLKDREDIAAAEAQYLKQLALLAAQQAKYEACRAAAESEDLDKIKAACN